MSVKIYIIYARVYVDKNSILIRWHLLEAHLEEDLSELSAHLVERMQSTCSAVGDADSRRYFHREGTLTWAAGQS